MIENFYILTGSYSCRPTHVFMTIRPTQRPVARPTVIGRLRLTSRSTSQLVGRPSGRLDYKSAFIGKYCSAMAKIQVARYVSILYRYNLLLTTKCANNSTFGIPSLYATLITNNLFPKSH